MTAFLSYHYMLIWLVVAFDIKIIFLRSIKQLHYMLFWMKSMMPIWFSFLCRLHSLSGKLKVLLLDLNVWNYHGDVPMWVSFAVLATVVRTWFLTFWKSILIEFLLIFSLPLSLYSHFVIPTIWTLTLGLSTLMCLDFLQHLQSFGSTFWVIYLTLLIFSATIFFIFKSSFSLYDCFFYIV